jgi:hypothetical protein
VYRQVEGLKMDISCPKHVVGITKWNNVTSVIISQY